SKTNQAGDFSRIGSYFLNRPSRDTAAQTSCAKSLVECFGQITSLVHVDLLTDSLRPAPHRIGCRISRGCQLLIQVGKNPFPLLDLLNSLRNAEDAVFLWNALFRL